jgi:hypothetical protein
VIELVGAVDEFLQAQSKLDVEYFLSIASRSFGPEEIDRMKSVLLKAYRWQYIFSGVENPRFTKFLGSLVTPAPGGAHWRGLEASYAGTEKAIRRRDHSVKRRRKMKMEPRKLGLGL